MERARAVHKTYDLLPEDCGYMEYTQIIKMHMPRNCKFNKADDVTSKIPILQILTKAGREKSTSQGQSPAWLPGFPNQKIN